MTNNLKQDSNTTKNEELRKIVEAVKLYEPSEHSRGIDVDTAIEAIKQYGLEQRIDEDLSNANYEIYRGRKTVKVEDLLKRAYYLKQKLTPEEQEKL